MNTQTNEMIYHYTSAHGLVGIVNNRRLWVTRSNFLNDPNEVGYGTGLVRDRIRAAQASLANGRQYDRLSEVIELLERDFLDPHSPTQLREDHAFVTSFSRRDDHLTLWRNYAGRQGFCIGFDRQELLSWCNAVDSRDEDKRDLLGADQAERLYGLDENAFLDARIVDVTYGETASGPALAEILRQITRPDFEVAKHEHLLRHELRRLIAIKHEAFADEREVRLVVQEMGDLTPVAKVRVSPASGLVAYHEIAFSYDAIRSVTIAPGVNAPQARVGLQSLLSDDGRGAWGHVEVRESPLPFSW